jgi:hypothetical protein
VIPPIQRCRYTDFGAEFHRDAFAQALKCRQNAGQLNQAGINATEASTVPMENPHRYRWMHEHRIVNSTSGAPA